MENKRKTKHTHIFKGIISVKLCSPVLVVRLWVSLDFGTFLTWICQNAPRTTRFVYKFSYLNYLRIQFFQFGNNANVFCSRSLFFLFGCSFAYELFVCCTLHCVDSCFFCSCSSSSLFSASVTRKNCFSAWRKAFAFYIKTHQKTTKRIHVLMFCLVVLCYVRLT